MTLKWTNSKLSTMLLCGTKYDFKVQQKIKVPTRPPLVRGTVVHEMVRLTMKRKSGPALIQALLERPDDLGLADLRRLKASTPGDTPIVDEIADEAATLFETKWKGDEEVDCQGEAPGPAHDWAKNVAINLSKHYLETVAPHISPLGVEMRVTVQPKDIAVELEGTLDLLAEGGLYRIHDTKTSEKAPPRAAADDSPQFDLYATLGLAKFGTLPTELSLDYVWETPGRKELKHDSLLTTRDDEDIRAMIARINAATLAVEKQVFVPAKPDSWECQSCEFRSARAGFPGCPFVRRGDRRPTN